MASVWGDAWGGDAWGVRVVVYTQAPSGGGRVLRRHVAKGKTEFQLLMEQIERDDEEVLAVIIEVVRLGALG